MRKSYMKLFRNGTILLLIPLALSGMSVLPSSAHAQSFTTTLSTSTENTPEVNARQMFDWRYSSSLIRTNVNQLPAAIITDLPLPILFGVAPSDLTRNFGDPRSGGRTHEGLDMMSPRGTPVISPTEAVVLSTGVWTGAGNYVSTANPGGETFVYMHLDKIADLTPGQILQPGGLIGYVGNTGNAAGGPTHLHFEVRDNNVATDPYPRLTREFSLGEKIGFLVNIFAQSTDKNALAQLLVANFPGQFVAVKNAGIVLPPEITTELARFSASGRIIIAPGDLNLGARGTAVTTLQEFLTIQNKGLAARALSNAGATGNFGPITESALRKYQVAVGITPADGNYGSATRIYIEKQRSLPAQTPVTPVPSIPSNPPASPTPTTLAVPARELTLGSKGSEVLWLQVFLIVMHTGTASEKLSAAGATGYFGSITRTALAEYQSKVNISPHTGYYGPVTRAHLTALLK